MSTAASCRLLRGHRGVDFDRGFRIPYILEGSVRAFNQEMLDKDLIEEQPLFYTMERNRNMWRYFETRTYRSGPSTATTSSR